MRVVACKLALVALLVCTLATSNYAQDDVGEAPEEDTTTTVRITTTASQSDDVGEAPEEDTTTSATTTTAPDTTTTTTTTESPCRSTLGIKYSTDNLLVSYSGMGELDCCSACQQNPQCVAWTARVIGSPMCLLFADTEQEALPPSELTAWASATVGDDDLLGFTCRDGALYNQQGQMQQGQSCSCSDSKCGSCRADRTTVCLKCTESTFLSHGTCVEECPAGHVAFVMDPSMSEGGVCRKPFSCVSNKDEEGEACSCDNFRNGCNDCVFGAGWNNVTCSNCQAGRWPVEGRCPRRAPCRRGEIMGSDVGDTCQCPDIEGCVICEVHKTDPTYRKCLNCAPDFKELDGGCVEGTCPSGYVPAGKGGLGQYCALPMVCRNNKVREGANLGSKCSCAIKNCLLCEFVADEGVFCNLCENRDYLDTESNSCVPKCDSSLTHYGTKRRGRECRQPFRCIDGKSSVDGSSCKCPDRHCPSCEYYAGNTDGKDVKCLSCYKYYLLNDECLPKCPQGYTGEGNSWRTRVCVPSA